MSRLFDGAVLIDHYAVVAQVVCNINRFICVLFNGTLMLSISDLIIWYFSCNWKTLILCQKSCFLNKRTPLFP